MINKINDDAKVQFFDNLTASIDARFRYQEMRIELAEYGEYGFIVGPKRQSETDYINDRRKLTESIEKVKIDIVRMQYLIDNIESCYELGISGYEMIDALGEDLWSDLYKTKENKMNDEEIDKLDKEHTAACNAFLDFSDILDDARKDRDAAREIMLVASRKLNEACKGKFLSE